MKKGKKKKKALTPLVTDPIISLTLFGFCTVREMRHGTELLIFHDDDDDGRSTLVGLNNEVEYKNTYCKRLDNDDGDRWKIRGGNV